MPDWVTWIVTAAAVLTASLFILKKLGTVLTHGYKGVGVIEDSLPVLKEVVRTFSGKDGALSVLAEISSQFRTDSGSSLRDSVDALCVSADAAVEAAETNRLVAEKASEENRRLITELINRFEVQRRLDEERTERQERLILKVDRVMVKMEETISDRAQVAADLTAREKKIDTAASRVASDLAAARHRADGIPPIAEPGAAADAASQTPPESTP